MLNIVQLKGDAQQGRGREILRMGEEHRPPVADPVVEADPPLGGVGLEVRGDVAELK